MIPLQGWKFFPLEEQIVGRRESRIGGIDISLKFLDGAPIARSHVESFRLACQVLPTDNLSAPFHFERLSSAPRLCGAASFTAGNDFLRLFYLHEGPHLLPAIYACKVDQRKSQDAVREIVEYAQMVQSMTIRPAQ